MDRPARRRATGALLAALVLLAGLVAPPGARAAPPEPGRPQVAAAAAVLMDVATGQVLFSKNGAERHYPASITKVLTALVAVRRARLDDVVTVDAAAAAVPGSSANLAAGDRLTVRDLLYGLLLVSGNDAAEALARWLAGSDAAFAAWMNDTARALGSTGSHFVNPHGLPDPEHYTTALDMARIARAAVSNPTIRSVVATRTHTAVTAAGRRITFVNENKLLGVDGVDGVKTGYTTEAGHTYVASATRGDRRLLVVLLDDTKEGKYQDALRLFDWGFAQYGTRTLIGPGDEVGQVQIRGGQRFYIPLVALAPRGVRVRAGPGDRVALRVAAPEVLPAPIIRGARLGTLEVRVNGRVVGSYAVVAGAGVAAGRPAALAAARGLPSGEVGPLGAWGALWSWGSLRSGEPLGTRGPLTTQESAGAGGPIAAGGGGLSLLARAIAWLAEILAAWA